VNPGVSGSSPQHPLAVPAWAEVLMRILGIDPGSAATGFGVVDSDSGKLVHVAHGTLRPPRSSPIASRLHYLHDAVAAVVGDYAPDAAAVEQVFVSISPRSALVLGQARGAALAALSAGGAAVIEYSASRIKLAVTGSGRAGKRQVQQMVRRLLELDRLPPSDAADALAAAICHANAGRLGALAIEAPTRARRSTLRVRRAR
jgi:crossover junction endodeoxyribonuclease RuvC